jgi:hypothetical protein
MTHYEGPERRAARQSAFDKLLHSIWGVLTIMGGVAVLSATVALGAQRYIGAPAANAQAIIDIINEDRALAVRVAVNEDDIIVLKDRDVAMEIQHVDINRSVQRLGIVMCASLGGPASPDREVRVACAALVNGDP